MIKAGFFECDITPPFRADSPGNFGKRKIKHFSDYLKVRAVAFYDGEKKYALIGSDTLGCGPLFLKRLQAMLPDVNFIHSASHTHYGGNLRDKIPDIDEAPDYLRKIFIDESVCYDDHYYNMCLQQYMSAVVFAFERLEEVEFSFGRGKVENLIFNRRIRMKDGSTKTHPGKGNPDNVTYAGPVDDELGVMGIWKKDSNDLLGFVLNFSCHACINLEGATSDFCGVAIDTVRAVFGKNAGAVYINGASGDVTQIDNLSLKKDFGKPVAIQLGRNVGAEAVKILANSPRGEISVLRYLNASYNMKYIPVDEDEIKEAYEKLKFNDQSADCKMAQSLVGGDMGRKGNPKPECELAVLQIGPLLIGSTPCEMFAQFALDFKKQSKFPFTWFSQLSYIHCYIPTADAFDSETGGGYEVATAKFIPETGHEMTAVISELSQKLTPEKAPDAEKVVPVNTAWGYNFKRKKKEVL